MRCAVFDLDGTLADTGMDLIAAANACFEANGYLPPLDPIQDKSTAFKGGRAMLSLGYERLTGKVDEAQIDIDFPKLLEFYGDKLSVHTKLYSNVVKILDQLADEGWILAVCTNKPVDLAVDLLKDLDIYDRFKAILGADSLSVRKPNPLHLTTTIEKAGGNVLKSVLVGDTITDRDAAKNANIPCILVSFGPDGDSVLNLNPEAVLDDYKQLPELLASMIDS